MVPGASYQNGTNSRQTIRIILVGDLMHYHKRPSRFSSLTICFLLLLGMLAAVTASCSAQPSITEHAALMNLREMTRDGKLPAESVVEAIENRFEGTTTGVLARLLRARIRLENGNPNGAADLLNSPLFAEKTELGDYALWLRGRSLLAAGNRNTAEDVFGDLIRKYPGSMRAGEARLMLAESLIESGKSDLVPALLEDLNAQNNGEALLLTARSFESRNDRPGASSYYRKAYFYAAGTKAGQKAEARLTELGEDLTPKDKGEIFARAEGFYKKGQFTEAAAAYDSYVTAYPSEITNELQFKRIRSYARSGQMPVAAFVFGKLPDTAKEKPAAFYEMATGYARARDWVAVQKAVNDLRAAFPKSDMTPKTMVAVGDIAGEQRRQLDKNYYLKLTLSMYPNAIEIAKAQFELAWAQHELKDFDQSSKMLTEHLARYVDEDTSYRGQSAYWAARDSEKAGKIDEACALYDGTLYRYGANWYGYLALQRLTSLRQRGKCQGPAKFPADSLVPRAIENLKKITVAAETATEKELRRAVKSEELGTVGLFDWAIEELQEAKKTADKSPKINLALAKHYRLKGDNVQALLALAPSYPDYPQMFPEEMGREEWDIFYPLSHWNEIKYWAGKRNLDPYHVAGLIRQETIFNPRAKSSANAYGLMQLLIPTAQSMAKKYGAAATSINGFALYNPSLNIELGTAYMREQLTKYGTIEYMSVAYNAGPGRVVSWKRTLPFEMDEFVEEIPFSETRGYVKGVIRNSAQYRRLYDEAGNFKPNVGIRPVRAAVDSIPAQQLAVKFPELVVEGRRKASK